MFVLWVSCLRIQYRVGLVEWKRAIKERMSLQDVETMMPHDLVNQLNLSMQLLKNFLDLLSYHNLWIKRILYRKLTHKRRLSALDLVD